MEKKTFWTSRPRKVQKVQKVRVRQKQVAFGRLAGAANDEKKTFMTLEKRQNATDNGIAIWLLHVSEDEDKNLVTEVGNNIVR